MMRSLVLALVCASCGRVSFDSRPTGDGGADATSPGVRVQVVEVAMDATLQTATIETVDPARTLLLCDYHTSSISFSGQPTCELTNATTVTVMTGAPEPTCIVRVQVVELPVGASVLRDVAEMLSTQTSLTIPIPAVDLATSFVVISRRTSFDTYGLDYRFRIAARLVDATTLELSRISNGNGLHVAWQIVTLPGARVFANQVTIAPAVTIASATIPAAVDASRSFVVASNTASSSDEADHMIATSLETATSVGFQRTGMGSATFVSYFVVEAPNVVVQRGQSMFGNQSVETTAIATVEPAMSMVVVSPFGGRAGQDTEHDKIAVAPELMPTQLELRRGALPPEDVGGGALWSVVEWQ